MGMTQLRNESTLTECRRIVFAFFSISILTFAIYSNTLDVPWHFDDEPNILERKALHITELNWSNIKGTLLNQAGIPYRPVSCLSLAVNYYFGGDAVKGYHLVNILIHLLTSMFLFLFIFQVLSLPVFQSKWATHKYSIAIVATLLWSLNPIQTQAVTYVVQRMTSLAAMFYILCMYLYVKARTSPVKLTKNLFFISSAISALLAMGAKENAFMIPISLYITELILLRNPATIPGKSSIKKANFSLTVAVGICVILFFLMKGHQALLGGYEHRTFTMMERLLTQPRVILFYISLIFYPAPARLSVQHDITLSRTLIDPPATLLSILLVLGAIVGAMILAKKRPFLSFAILFFFINHLIESSFLPLEMVFEHRNYVPSMFLFVPFAMLFCYGIFESRLNKWTKFAILMFLPCLLIGYGHGTYVRNFIWKTEESLWLNATEVAPDHWRPYHNLGKYHAINRSYGLALSAFSQALSKSHHPNKDDKKMTFYNLGYVYQSLGQKEKAFSYYSEAKHLDPKFGPARNNKAVLLAESGRTQEAIAELQEAIRLDPKLPSSYINLGRILLSQNMVDEAIGSFEKSIQLDKTNPLALKELGSAYRQKGLFSKAYLAYSKSLRYSPQDLSPLLYLSELYSIRGMGKQKDQTMARFLKLIPEHDLTELIKNLKNNDKARNAVSIDRETAIRLIAEALNQMASDSMLKAERLRNSAKQAASAYLAGRETASAP